MTFPAQKKQKGDLLKSEDWNALTAEVERLAKEKLDRNQGDTFRGSLTVEGALNIKPKSANEEAELSITGDLNVSQSLSVNDGLTVKGNFQCSNGAVTDVLAIGDIPSAGNTGGNREWMKKGLKINWDSDSLFIGLKDEAVNRKDAVIAWGDDANDNLRFINVSSGGAVNGKDVMTLTPEGNLSVSGAISGKIDAVKIDSGILSVDRIPNLPANKITAGTITGDLTVNGAVQLGGFTGNDQDEWPKLFWYRDVANNWDEGLIKHNAAKGVFKKAGYGIHLHETKEFGFWSTSWNPLFAVEGQSGNTFVKGNLTVTGVMSGAANGYQKAQFTMSGGGTVTWEGSGGRLKWTQRFIAISMEKSTSFPTGHINIFQPTINIPATQVFDQTARSANEAGVILKGWEALYAVHTIGGNESSVSFQIVSYTNNFNAPSNWLLVAVINGENNTVKLGTGAIITPGGTLTVNGAITPSAGNSENNGIMFPKDPVGGGGDAAWIRYYRRGDTGEATTFEIGTSNDADDHIALISAGGVGIGTINPAAKLEVKGTTKTTKLQLGDKWLLSGDGDGEANDTWLRLKSSTVPQNYYGGFAAEKLWCSSGVANGSDIRMKKDIKSLSKSLEKIALLRGVEFRWKDNQQNTLPQIGIIAQEVEAVFPELVEIGPNNMKSVNYTGFIPILIEGIKEQQEQISTLLMRIKEQQSQIEKLT